MSETEKEEADARQHQKQRQEDARKAPVISSERMLREEYAYILGDPEWVTSKLSLPELIASLHAGKQDMRPMALCLSGGGIRSATFSLGVMQYLANRKHLQDFHYLSTVSGGGYMGSFLVNGLWQAYSSRWQEVMLELHHPTPKSEDDRNFRIERLLELKQQRKLDKLTAEGCARRGRLLELYREARAVRRAEAAGRADAAAWMRHLGNSAGSEHAAGVAGAARITNGGRDPVAPLRAYSNYLSPTGGLSTDTFALVAIFLRNLLLNLLVWLPLVGAAVGLPRLFIAALTGELSLNPTDWTMWWPLWAALGAIILGIGYTVADLPASRWRPPAPPQTPPANQFNAACFLPITLAAVTLSLLGAWTEPLHRHDWYWFVLAGALAHVLGVGVGVLVRKFVRKLDMRPASLWGFVVVAVVGGVGGALTSMVLSHLGEGVVAAQMSASQLLLYASLAVPALTGAFWLAMALHAGLMGRFSSEEDREWWARATAAWLKFTLVWIAAFALVIWAPLIVLEHAADAGLAAVKFGVGGSALGVMTALVGYWSKNGAQVKGKAQGALRATGLRLLDLMATAVLVCLVLALSLAWNVVLERCHGWAETVCADDVRTQTDLLRDQVSLRAAVAGLSGGDAVRTLTPEADPLSAEIAKLGDSAGAQVYAHVLLHGSGRALAVACALLVALAAFMAYFMGANQFSLHGMYGNRLVRAYLGSGRTVRHPHWFTRFDPEDNPKLADLRAPLRGSDACPRLFPLVNIALNLVKPSEKRLAWQQRKAASFFTTPLHCGSAHLGFRPTEFYAGGVSLGRAMTISGAAASPNMGYHSSPLVTLVMTLFNVRLGWWSPNPAVNADWHQERPALGLDIMLAEASGATGDEDNFAYLSDGGHFDNTGIYEMVRRRCRRIVLVDASCDGDFRWNDLLDVVRKIRVDFGVPIDLHGPLPGGGRKSDHPRWLTGTLKYSSRDQSIRDGELIVLKPMLLDGDPPELAAYARDSAKEGSAGDANRFPHQSTADQFYDERQFESYRLLGYLTAEAALGQTPAPAPVARRRLKSPSPAAGVAIAKPDEGAHGTAASPVGGGMGDPTGGTGGIGQLVGQMGSSMALATALTVGGTLGVAGTVALQPSEISLSTEDRTLVKEALKELLKGGSLTLTKEDRTLLEKGVGVQLDWDAVRALESAANKLDDAVKGLQGWTPTSASQPLSGNATVRLDAASLEALNALRLALQDAITSGKPGSMQALRDAIVALQSTVEKLKTDPELARVFRDALEEMKSAVNTAPRRNIRGQEGSPK